MIERETHFNAMNPFWQAPYAYGAGVALARLSLGIRLGRPARSSFPALMGSTIYRLGLVGARALGIALEIYGFYLRVRISGWAPVTNMYETVIWVALVAAVLSFVFEMIYRKVFIGAGRVGGRAAGHDHGGQRPASGPEHQEPPAGPAEQLLADDPRL